MKGFLISTVLILPFTFIPVIGQEGSLGVRILARLPWSLLYAGGFALLVVLAALGQNYDSLKSKLVILNSPAFQNLEFKPHISGHDLFSEIDVGLIGDLKGVGYLLNLVLDAESKKRLLVIKSSNHQPIVKLDLRELNLSDPWALKKYLSTIQ